MSFNRALLGVLAAFVLLAGVGCLLVPAAFAEQAGFATGPSALTEIRAFYGGLQVGIGVFLVWCMRLQDRIATGLLLGGLAVGSEPRRERRRGLWRVQRRPQQGRRVTGP